MMRIRDPAGSCAIVLDMFVGNYSIDKIIVCHIWNVKYAKRDEMSEKWGEGFKQLVQGYCLEQFVEECYHKVDKDNELIIGTRLQRHKKYSRYDPALKFADKKYPFVHLVQFPELFDKRLKNGDPAGDMYWRWCQLQLTIHKPWHKTPLTLWNEGRKEHEKYESIAKVEPCQFIRKWHEFVGETERGREVQNHNYIPYLQI